MSSKGRIQGRGKEKKDEECLTMKDPVIKTVSQHEVKNLSATEKALVNTGNLSKF